MDLLINHNSCAGRATLTLTACPPDLDEDRKGPNYGVGGRQMALMWAFLDVRIQARPQHREETEGLPSSRGI